MRGLSLINMIDSNSTTIPKKVLSQSRPDCVDIREIYWDSDYQLSIALGQVGDLHHDQGILSQALTVSKLPNPLVFAVTTNYGQWLRSDIQMVETLLHLTVGRHTKSSTLTKFGTKTALGRGAQHQTVRCGYNSAKHIQC